MAQTAPQSPYLHVKSPPLHSSCRHASIQVSPSPCLLDEPVQVVITGLDSNDIYTLQSSITDCKGVPFTAVSHYQSDARGTVDLTHTPAVGGHFSGVFPMGPFVCILPTSSKLKDPRFSFQDVTKPLRYELSVYEGAYGYHLLLIGEKTMGLKPVCRTVHERHLVGAGCRRIPVTHGRVRGVLHIPPGRGPFPGVVDMFGSAGGLMEHRSALLAARGVAALSLAFFNYNDLPENMNYLQLEYFKEAVAFLLSRDEVSKTGVGAIGTSKGGEIVLEMALAIPEVKVGVVINGSCYNGEESLHVGGKAIRVPAALDLPRVKIHRDLRLELKSLTEETEGAAEVIPVEKIQAHVLWIVGLDDKNFPSARFAGRAFRRYVKHNPHSRNKFEVVQYAGAGHLIEPPYVPFCDVSYHRMVSGSIVWGGNAVAHTRAQVDAWRRMIALFRDQLTLRTSKL